MNRATLSTVLTVLLLAGCGNGGVTSNEPVAGTERKDATVAPPEKKPAAGGASMTTAKLKGPVQISYRIIGEPIVGQPVAIDLQFKSSLGTQPFNVSYRVNDSTALELPDTQPAAVTIAPALGDERAAQQVTVIPMREGRLFLNVAAQVEGDFGSVSSVTAVPIQVGRAPRELLENGTVETDESGELIRSLPATEN